jgi:hypothetical protein
MPNEILVPGRLTFLTELVVDWYDRSICSVVEGRPRKFLLKSLIAWNFTEKHGIGLYFPANPSLVESVKSSLQTSWDVACRHVREFAMSFEGAMTTTIENNNEIICIRTVQWPLEEKLRYSVCDVDSTFNNPDICAWERFILEQQ